MLSRLSQSQSLLDRLRRQRWRGKRLMEPRPEVAVDEQIHPQQRDEIRQGPAKARLELQELEQHQGDQRGPDLNVERVGRGADKRFDAQVLFERLEEELDLPPVLINARDGGGAECQVIRQELQP